jgi:NAD(P)H-flavin reductase
MHLTKRFGIVAASQLPLHYLLAMKSAYSPLQMLTGMSHEKLNSVHQVLGKIIQYLLTLHATFYLNFFIRVNVLSKRIKDRDVILGLVCITIITITSTATITAIRKWNYRLFYMIHVVLATLFLPLAYFHVHHIRPFILESAGIYIVHFVLRIVNGKRQSGSITLVPATNLIQIKIPLNSQTRHFKAGQHVYFSLPQGYRGSSVPSIFLRNPFTVASLPQKDGQLVLVARTLDGNTKKLAALARQADLHDGAIPRSLPLNVEGPYGSALHTSKLSGFNRILLVAGGVGATFIIPLWRTILDVKRSNEQQFNVDVKLVWAVRKLVETSWALPLPESASLKSSSGIKSEAEIYVTTGSGSSVAGGSNEIELAETDELIEADDEEPVANRGIVVKHRRPDLHDIVHETFSGHVGRVAVFVCGPAGMWKQLRREVRRQVWRGKDIYWHAEEFGL